MSDVTRILNALKQGDLGAASQLLPLIYEELRKLAAQKLAQEQPGQTLQPTALVHEVYLRLVVPPQQQKPGEEPPWAGEKLALTIPRGRSGISRFSCVPRRFPPHPAVGRPLPKGGEVPKTKGQSVTGVTWRRR